MHYLGDGACNSTHLIEWYAGMVVNLDICMVTGLCKQIALHTANLYL